jgi:hypothetical protein
MTCANNPAVTNHSCRIGADLAARRPANPITLCDGHGSEFVTVAGQILMAVHTGHGTGWLKAGDNDAHASRRSRSLGD